MVRRVACPARNRLAQTLTNRTRVGEIFAMGASYSRSRTKSYADKAYRWTFIGCLDFQNGSRRILIVLLVCLFNDSDDSFGQEVPVMILQIARTHKYVMHKYNCFYKWEIGSQRVSV